MLSGCAGPLRQSAVVALDRAGCEAAASKYVAIVLANKLAHEARDSGVSGFDMLAGIARSLRASARFFCPFR